MRYSPTLFSYRVIFLMTILSLIGVSVCAQEGSDTSRLKPWTLPFVSEYRPLQFSIWPALGADAGAVSHYANDVSLSLLYGYNSANFIWMYATLFNRSLYYASGVQVAGLLNMVRRMEYGLSTDRYEELEETEKVEGVQFTGGINFVGRKLTGVQMAGFYNNVLRDTKGLQMAGVGSRTGRFISGMQVSGLLNIGVRKVSGAQLSAGLNFTQGDLKGLQLGLANVNKRTKVPWGKGKKKQAVQVGLFNKTDELEGYQIGILNITKKFYGTQIGLINLYKRSPYQGSNSDTYGSPFGLINLGTSGGLVAFYTDESLLLAGELTTGNCMNCKWNSSGMPISGRFMKYVHNAVVYQVDLNEFDPLVDWKLGYGVDWVHLNKHSMIAADPKNKRYQLRLGFRMMRVFYDPGVTNLRSFESKLKLETGYRLFGSYLYLGSILNARWATDELPAAEFTRDTSAAGRSVRFWPGLQLGVRL